MGMTKLNITIADQAMKRIRLASQSINNITLTAPVAEGGGNARISIDTTDGWNEHMTYVPREGEFIVYSDRHIVDEINYPGVKIGDGRAYVVDLPFVGDEITNEIVSIVNMHINNHDIHISSAERTFWNNKLNYDVEGETLILNRL